MLTPLACACDADERCDACYRKIAGCCYEDPAVMLVLVSTMVAQCEADSACRSCCKECEALDCTGLRERNFCPMSLPGG